MFVVICQSFLHKFSFFQQPNGSKSCKTKAGLQFFSTVDQNSNMEIVVR